MIEYLAQPVYQRLALTLLHFLWQGAFIALLLAICLRIFRSSQLRYAACCGALLAIIVVPVLTFAIVSVPTPDAQFRTDETAARTAISPPAMEMPQGDSGEEASDNAKPIRDGEASSQAGVVASIGPWCVLVWMIGTLFFGGRLILGFTAVRRMLRNRAPIPAVLQTAVERIANRLRLRTAPGVFTSERIRDAMAVGFFRPVVLLPLSWLTQLPPEVLRSVLAHELAHIRRWDQWVNLLQRVVEAVLFYHPAVWWVSNRTRAEREFRCDELALAAAGGAATYAESLERVARFRLNEREPLLANSMGGTRMALLNRVKNVLGMSDSPRGRTWWAVGLLAIALPTAIFASSLYRPAAKADETVVKDDEGEAEERKVEKREVRREVERDVRREGERRERELAERERNERRERGERRERERREGAKRERREGDRGDRREGERRRDGDRRDPPRGDGERPRRDGDRREGERRRDGDRRERGDRRDGDRRKLPRGAGGANLRELIEAIRVLRTEVQRLRKEVDELKGRRKRGPYGAGALPRRQGNNNDDFRSRRRKVADYNTPTRSSKTRSDSRPGRQPARPEDRDKKPDSTNEAQPPERGGNPVRN